MSILTKKINWRTMVLVSFILSVLLIALEVILVK
jgi:hypothetical protein